MKFIKQFLLFNGLVLLLYACSSGNASGVKRLFTAGGDQNEREAAKEHSEKLSPAEYMAWVQNKENGLKVEKTIGEFTYSAQYKPLAYVALLELKSDTVSEAVLKQKMEEFSGLQYFTLQISADSQQELLKKNLTETNDYYGRIQYFSFDMQRDLKLIEGKDTLNCELFHFERVYGLAPYARFVLGFPKTNDQHDKTLFLDEKVFGSGKVYLTIQAKNNNQLPAVITNEYETK
jgi:hypothetical protein